MSRKAGKQCTPATVIYQYNRHTLETDHILEIENYEYLYTKNCGHLHRSYIKHQT